MLVVTRKAGQRITIKTPNGRITVFIDRIESRKQMRIGIDAPKEFQILRSELLDRKVEVK